MQRYTSGYANTLRQFVIQNLPCRLASPWSPILKVALNILQRGNPTRMPDALAAALEIESADALGQLPASLIPVDPPAWRYSILGNDDTGDNPAKYFFEVLVPEAVGPGATWLLQPEVPITDILQREHADLSDQRVDFYLPDVRSVIEIDGSQHQAVRQGDKDRRRDEILADHGVSTIRIPTAELRAGAVQTPNLVKALEQIRAARAEYKTLGDLAPTYRISLRAVAAFRLQVVLLELMLSGQLPLDGTPWELSIRCDDAEAFADAAISDLLGLIQETARLHRVEVVPPTAIRFTDPQSAGIRVDLSCLRRWTDQDVDDRRTIFVRSDYISEYPDRGYVRRDTRADLKGEGLWWTLDHFQVEFDEALITSVSDESESDPLKPVLARLFGYESFRRGQRHVLVNALARDKTVGILPTGQGKSLCYQLPAMVQPGTTVVISPLRSLMRDQVAELHQMGIDRVASISSEDSAVEKRFKMERFAKGAYQILLVSPERFQVPEFRDVCLALMGHGAVHYAVVDEVHCLSEWGHDFRLAYLNLANVIQRCFPKARFIGLTATASANVITDIRHEFRVPDEDVIYRLDLRRPNLEFQVRPVTGAHQAAISSWLRERVDAESRLPPRGIVFTPHVNGRRGCYAIAGKISADLNIEVGSFSGSRPNNYPGTEAEFELEKLNTQDRFKQGDLHVLCATKAFGMGINKRDVRFTAHLGIPSSMEALYQEAGRAGRDGEHADCMVFASMPDESLKDAFAPTIEPMELQALVDGQKADSDLRAQLWLVVKDLTSIRQQFSLTKRVLSHLQSNPNLSELRSGEIQGCEDLRNRAFAVQQAIYRLAQLGYVTDWTVLDFFHGVYSVDFVAPSEIQVTQNLLQLVQSYSGRSEIKTLMDICEGDSVALATIFTDPPRPLEDVAILLLLRWSFKHFNYARRQSMKTVFELCESYDALGNERFRQRLEDFFQIDSRTNQLHRLIDGGVEVIGDWAGVIYGASDHSTLDVGDPAWNDHIEQIQGMINRLLESFQNNVALDMLSAMVRLLRGRYQDTDGRGRLMAQLTRSSMSMEDRASLLTFALDVGRHARPADRELLASDLLQVLPGRQTALTVHEALGDQHSLTVYMNHLASGLAVINRSLSHGFAAR